MINATYKTTLLLVLDHVYGCKDAHQRCDEVRASGVLGCQGSPIHVVNFDGCEISGVVTDVKRVMFDSCVAANAETEHGAIYPLF